MKKIALVLICAIFIATFAFAGGQTSSGKTIADIITIVRIYLNEVTASFWSDADLTRYTNAALTDVVARTHCLQDQAQIVLSGNTRAYTWSGVSAYVAIEDRVYYFNSGTSKYQKLFRDETIIGRVQEHGPPEYWYESQGKIYFWPVPSSAQSGHTVYVDYVPLHNTYNGTTNVIYTPASYDQCLVFYVLSQAKLKQGKVDEAEYYMKRYEILAERYRQDFITRPPEQRTNAK